MGRKSIRRLGFNRYRSNEQIDFLRTSYIPSQLITTLSRLQESSPIFGRHCDWLREQKYAFSGAGDMLVDSPGQGRAKERRGCQTTLTLCGNLALQERNEAARAPISEDDEDGGGA